MNDMTRRELFSAWLDGRITAEGAARLDGELRGSREARDEFREWALLDSLLAEQAAAASASPAPPAPPRWLSKRWWGGAAALLLVGTLIGLVAAKGTRPSATVPLAMVTSTRFADVDDSRTPFAVGQPLDLGRVALLGGAVEITLRNGVVIVLEGEADLDLRGEMEAFLHGGSVVVRMPAGMQGFKLSTPTTDVLDLGTEFAVRAGAGLITDVQVYDGAVIASSNAFGGLGLFPKRLEAGESVRFLPQSAADPVRIPFAERRFVRRLAADLPPEPATEAERAAERRWPGRPHFTSIVVSRAESPITIDGSLEEWQTAAGFARTAHAPAGKRSLEVRGWMKYDAEHLYIAAHVGDPAPMRSEIDPAIDPDRGWAGGSVQVRLSTDRGMGWPAQGNSDYYFAERKVEPTPEQRARADNPRLSHLTLWYHAAAQTPCLTIAHGMHTETFDVNPEGFRGAFVRDADGQGYCLEYAVPWRLLNCADDPPQRGDDLAALWQVHWSDETGRLRRSRDHLVEVRNPDEPLRINSWNRAATWGRAEYR